jgi:hypothetical protein
MSACATTAPPDTAVPSALAATYIDLVTDSNAATCTFNRSLSRSAPALGDLTAASADYAESLATLVDGLDALDWPDAIADHAAALIAALSVDRDIAREMAAAETLEDFLAANNRLIEANDLTAEAAGWVREDLDLSLSGDPCTT